MALSIRSSGTAVPEVEVAQASVVGASPGPMSVPSPIIPERYHNTPRLLYPTQKQRHKPIVSERAAIAVSGGTLSSLRAPVPKKPRPEPSVTVSSASDLSVIRTRHRHRRERSVSSSRTPRRSRRHRHRSRTPRRQREKTPPPAKEEDKCGRCHKTRAEDPLDPSHANLSGKKKERIRLELIRRIQRLKKNNPNEDIHLPERGVKNVATCYRRYKRIARHLYAKRSIATYRLLVFIFTLFVQMAMSILFGPAAADYLKREYEEIAKYDAVFYEMGCRAYSPGGEAQSPEYRFAFQLVVPILMIAATFVITRYTPVSPTIVGIFTQMATAYLKNGETTEYRSLLHDDSLDEPEADSDSDDGEDAVAHMERTAVHIPDLEAELPNENPGAAAIQAAVPGIINMLTSLRAQPEGSAPAADGSGLIGTVMNIAQAFMGGKKTPPPATTVLSSPPRTAAPPAFYDE